MFGSPGLAGKRGGEAPANEVRSLNSFHGAVLDPTCSSGAAQWPAAALGGLTARIPL